MATVAAPYGHSSRSDNWSLNVGVSNQFDLNHYSRAEDNLALPEFYLRDEKGQVTMARDMTI